MKTMLLLLPLYLCSFEVTMIDETAEGIQRAKLEAKQNDIAKDGKIIYKPMTTPVMIPMAPLVIEPTNLIIKPMQKNIIYPKGQEPKVIEKVESAHPKSKKEYFVPQEQLEKSSVDTVEIKVDTSFDGMKENTTAKTLTPINIE